MSMLKKIISIGNSKAIIIPYEFIAYYKLQGKEIKKVRLELTDKLIITPIFEEGESESKKETPKEKKTVFGS
jgi:antitoxin component of MazEF toxin-antitoxin module